MQKIIPRLVATRVLTIVFRPRLQQLLFDLYIAFTLLSLLLEFCLHLIFKCNVTQHKICKNFATLSQQELADKSSLH